jgi:hypothetical protein
MTKVYVTQEANVDFTPALSFGEVEFITKEDVSPMPNSIRNEELVNKIRHTMTRFNPDEDYIVIAGSPYVAALVFYVLGRYRRVRYIRMLRWSNRDRMYSPLTIDIGE